MATPHPTLQFLGATGTVTGSKFLVRAGDEHVLVDCGLFQGPKELRQRNREPLGEGGARLDARQLDAVVLTHAHVDHCGYLPALWRQGYRGPVYATQETLELVSIVLPDAGRLQEEEARFANERGYSKHRPALPLFTEEDALACLSLLRPARFHEPVALTPRVGATLGRAGHILGSAHVQLCIDDHPVLVISGDLGRAAHPLLVAPDPPPAGEVMLIESTYGDERHPSEDGPELLADVVRTTARRGGTVIIPSFAVDRTEIILFHLRRLVSAGAIPELPVYVDSPMALSALAVYRRAIAQRGADVEIAPSGEDPLDPGRLVEVRTVEESKRLTRSPFPSVIIAASGMATGGRVLHHLAAKLDDPRAAVVLPGFQAAGTRGRQLADGARQIKMFGEYVPVRARVVQLPGFSVHAGQDELLAWAAAAPVPPRLVCVVHGEPDASQALADALADRHGLNAVVPRMGEIVSLAGRERRAAGA